MEEAEDDAEYVSNIRPELLAEEQRELIHLLKTHKDTQSVEVKGVLLAWLQALEKSRASDMEVAWEQARLYDAAGLTELALDQLEDIFDRLDQTDPDNRTESDRAIGNMAIDMEAQLLGR